MTVREAYEALKQRRISAGRGLEDRMAADGGVAVLTVEECRDVIRSANVGLDLPPQSDLMKAAADCVKEMQHEANLHQQLRSAAPEMWCSLLGAALMMAFEDGYIVRALQESGS